jgi:quinol monooxygenase YgiN
VEATGSAAGALPGVEGARAMYARSTTFKANLRSMDMGIEFLRAEVVPAVQAMPGCIGISMMADRTSGRCIVTSSWDSMDDMRASDAAVAPMRARAGQLLGGLPFVEEWEIAAMHRHHRTHEGACVRATWMHGAAPDLDRGVDLFKMVTMPAMEGLDGFCSASLFLDRTTGRAVISATYDSTEMMVASREQAMDLRRRTAREARVDILDVAEFDLLLAHLRVPEMA